MGGNLAVTSPLWPQFLIRKLGIIKISTSRHVVQHPYITRHKISFPAMLAVLLICPIHSGLCVLNERASFI